MAYAAVLTHVQAEPESSPRLACAVAMAERFGAVLIGMGAEMIPPLAFDSGFYSFYPDWVTAMREAIEGRRKIAQERFAAATADLGERAIWTSRLELPCLAMATASRAVDLIVAGGCKRRKQDSYCDASPAELAVTSGRPVLIAPSKGAALVARKIVLAWKDTREARRALSDALPFLAAAEAVEVLAICPKADAADAKTGVEDVAASLGRRGVKARPRVIETAHPDGLEILAAARAFGADLIVAGAYGHSRLGEWVFGGVTYDLLAQDQCYLLLSH